MAEYQSDAGSTKDIPYLTLMGKLWGVLCVYLWENWLRYNRTTLYVIQTQIACFSMNKFIAHLRIYLVQQQSCIHTFL